MTVDRTTARALDRRGIANRKWRGWLGPEASIVHRASVYDGRTEPTTLSQGESNKGLKGRAGHMIAAHPGGSCRPHGRGRRSLSAWRRRRETHSRTPYPSPNPTIRAITISIGGRCYAPNNRDQRASSAKAATYLRSNQGTHRANANTITPAQYQFRSASSLIWKLLPFFREGLYTHNRAVESR